jgi:hypothetical protein
MPVKEIGRVSPVAGNTMGATQPLRLVINFVGRRGHYHFAHKLSRPNPFNHAD